MSNSKKEQGCSRMWTTALKLCLLEQLADDFAAHGQKRLTGHPACQPPPAPSETALCAVPLTCLDTRRSWKEIQMCCICTTLACSLDLTLVFRASLYSKTR